MEPSASARFDCDFDPNSLPIEEALRRIDAVIQPVGGVERLALRSALERVLAEDVRSPIDVPSFPNSAMDGYALAASSLAADGDCELRVVGTAWAGRPFQGSVGPGECVRIMTGAKIPAGADTVVMQEHVQRHEDRVRVEAGHKQGQNVRHAGQDVAAGEVILPAGKHLQPADIGLLAALGIPEVGVRRKVRVAFFSTGDELRSLGEVLGEGEIYDSNRYTLHGMLTRLGVEIIDMGVVRDRPEEVEAAFRQSAEIADAVITSGGASVGDADYVKATLDRLGKVDFWKLAMKPGRPLAFGQLGQALFFGLPGNPVSAMATFYQFVRPALARLMGRERPTPFSFQVPCASALKKVPGRVDFQRGILERDANGQLYVRSTGPQGSHVLSSMSKANCFIVLPADWGDVEPGTPVEVQPFEGLV